MCRHSEVYMLKIIRLSIGLILGFAVALGGSFREARSAAAPHLCLRISYDLDRGGTIYPSRIVLNPLTGKQTVYVPGEPVSPDSRLVAYLNDQKALVIRAGTRQLVTRSSYPDGTGFLAWSVDSHYLGIQGQ